MRAAADAPRRVADVVSISSTAGRVARPGNAVYALTKFGIGAFSEAVRQEVLGQRVRVGLVEPGTVQTEITTALPPESQVALENRTAGMVNLNLPTSPMPFGLHGDPRPAGCGQRNPRALGRTNLVDRYQR